MVVFIGTATTSTAMQVAALRRIHSLRATCERLQNNSMNGYKIREEPSDESHVSSQRER